MNSSEDVENFKLFLQYQHSFIVSKVLQTASSLGIFDLLRESGEFLSSETIAERLGTSLTGMERLLEASVGLKLLKMERKDNKDFYGNTGFANLYLAKSSPKSQYYIIKFCSEVSYTLMQSLPDAVREGKGQLSSVCGDPSDNVFDVLYRSKEGVEKFSNAMNAIWNLLGREVLTAFDLSPFPLIFDVGGNTGILAKELIAAYPNCRATVFDLPEVVELSKQQSLTSEQSQINFHAGDFFKDPIPEADLYILARILHDWNDEQCLQLLRKLFKACKPGGGVLIVEILLDEDRSGPLLALTNSLLMLMLTQGKERTASEFNLLLNTAGFQDVESKKGSIYDIILARQLG